MIYNFDTGQFFLATKNGIRFVLPLRPKVTVVKGDSATGKTLLWKTIETIKKTEKDMASEKLAHNIELINRYTDEDKIETLLAGSDKLIIIDNADMLFRVLPQLAENIADSAGNHFLVFSRDTADLGVTPNHYGEFYVEGKEIGIKYPFTVKGWL